MVEERERVRSPAANPLGLGPGEICPKDGAPERIRTPNLQIRSLCLRPKKPQQIRRFLVAIPCPCRNLVAIASAQRQLGCGDALVIVGTRDHVAVGIERQRQGGMAGPVLGGLEVDTRGQPGADRVVAQAVPA